MKYIWPFTKWILLTPMMLFVIYLGFGFTLGLLGFLVGVPLEDWWFGWHILVLLVFFGAALQAFWSRTKIFWREISERKGKQNEVAQLDLWTSYNFNEGKGGVSIDWVGRSNHPSLDLWQIRVALVVALYARHLVNLGDKNSRVLFVEVTHQATEVVNHNGDIPLRFDSWQIEGPLGVMYAAWPWDIISSPSLLHKPKHHIATLHLRTDGILTLNLKLSGGGEANILMSGALLAVLQKLSQELSPSKRVKMANLLLEINRYYHQHPSDFPKIISDLRAFVSVQHLLVDS